MRQVARRDLTPEVTAVLVAGLLAVLATGAVAALAGQSAGVRAPSSPIHIGPAEEGAPATPAVTVVPIVQPATGPPTAPATPTPAPRISTPLPTERALPTEVPAQVPSSFRPGSNRIPPPSIPPQN